MEWAMDAKARYHGQAAARIDRDPRTMERLTRALGRQREFTLDAENYRRPKSAAPSKLLEPWYQVKSFTISHQEKLTDELFSREIVGAAAEWICVSIALLRLFCNTGR